MKRKLLKAGNFLILILGLLFLSTTVKADDIDYDITNLNVIARVQTNGSLKIKQQVTYDFDDDAHGVYYQQNLAKGQELTNLKIKIKADDAKETANHSYTLASANNTYKIKLFHQIAADSKFRVTYYYTITNAITNYRDIARLNFMIVGDGWDEDLDNVRAQVLFPGKINKLQAWAHGPLGGYTKVQPDQGKITMTAKNLDKDRGIEVDTIFPPAVTKANHKRVDKNKRQAVLKQERNLARQANQELKKVRQRLRLWYIVGWLLVIGGIGLSGLAIYRGLRAQRFGTFPQKINDLVHNYEIPTVNPVAAQVLDTAKEPDSKAFTAYLLDLVRQKRLELTSYQRKRKTYYRISLVDEELLKQDKLLKLLFNKVGDKKSFTTYGLRKYKKDDLGRSFSRWQTRQRNLVKGKGLLSTRYENKLDNLKTTVGSLSILSMVCLVLGLIFFHFQLQKMITLICLPILLIADITVYLIAIKRIAIYTKKGAEVTNQVRGFKKMLQDIGQFKMKDVGDLILWEQIMPYAVSFGLSKRVLKQLKIEFDLDRLDNNDSLYFGYYSSYYTGLSFEAAFQSSFEKSVSHYSSSSSGSSGGFSGGSSGGFGGGSGGGAF
ncbi:DUF2207 domain-containing protein [Lactobacillus sp. ESL0681]|uniref:DUF2207 domain-containing protein n=1 Tax=Lactobacillus sp. ESL0681 TaxID=2983211 RepID=UPI0023F76CD5|nr:DUF2207 domain-containing protein [Lactobacillus sp. ESL0681]WEV39525.1 DUF2207 domain-containing protein [Lactobacillus sp. ESL0681]